MEGKYSVLVLVFKNVKEGSFISAKEQQSAENLLIRMERQHVFGKQFMAVRKETKENLKDQMELYEDNVY